MDEEEEENVSQRDDVARPSSNELTLDKTFLKEDIEELLSEIKENFPAISSVRSREEVNVQSERRRAPAKVKPKQKEMAQDILKKIRKTRQTMDRLQAFVNEKLENGESFLQDLKSDESEMEVNKRVLRNAPGEESSIKFDQQKERILSEPRTLYYIVHDEAHYNQGKGTTVDKFVNDQRIRNAKNVVILQVSATPYALVTKNSRIKEDNVYDMGEKNGDSSYVGVNEFVEETHQLQQSGEDLQDLKPKTYTTDEDFESVANGTLKAYISKKFKCIKCKNREAEIRNTQLYASLLLQYIAAIIQKSGRSFDQFKPKSALGQYLLDHLHSNNATTKMISRIDGRENGKGDMILVRIIRGVDGILFTKTLREVRDILGFGDKFSILLDIDLQKQKSRLYEDQFLPRLKSWNHQDFRPRTYEDLLDLPVILIVVEKGKMGITYPRSLRYYDLRMRYWSGKDIDDASDNAVAMTRGALEQDIGRACRYHQPEDPYLLPTILVGSVLHRKLSWMDARNKGKQRGIFKLDPDYRIYMVRKKGQFPEDDSDLKPYQEWEAGKEHCDYNNFEKLSNRYLLYGRPQLGKTGVFLHLGYLLWELVGSPKHTGPEIADLPKLELESEEEGEEEEEGEQTEVLNQGIYPDYDYMDEKLTLKKPSISKTYGDPNDPNVLNWYKQGNRRPHITVQSSSNKTVKKSRGEIPSTGREGEISGPSRSSSSQQKKSYSKFASRPLRRASRWKMDEVSYEEYPIEMEGSLGGRLLLNIKTKNGKWSPTFTTNIPTLRTNLDYPPIIIPSCNRSHTALLDLRQSMEGEKNYVQIVVIREEEVESYLPYLLSDDNIDIFIMKGSTPTVIGAARSTAKKLAEKITRDGFNIKFCFLMDDRISCFQAVTLINDPNKPIEGVEPSDEYSQRTDISLLELMKYTSKKNKDSRALHNFSIIGISTTSHKRINKMKIAFGRKHLFAAVFLNIEKLGGIEYNENAWAMEDIDFNIRTDERGGVLVKCQRFIAWKEKLSSGGVTEEKDYQPEQAVTTIETIEEESREIQEWFKPFSEKGSEWSLMEIPDEGYVLSSFSEWAAPFYTRDQKSKELTKKLSSILTQSDVTFKDRIKRCVSVLEQIEKYIQEERSEEETIQFIIKIEMNKKRVSEQSSTINPSSSSNNGQSKKKKKCPPDQKNKISDYYKKVQNE